jgi:hypothetical protein
MTRFYGIVDGDRGHTNSHRTGVRWLNTYTNTWHNGIQVGLHRGVPLGKNPGDDFFDIYITHGSSSGERKLLLSLTVKEMDILLNKNKDISLMDLYLSQGKRVDND